MLLPRSADKGSQVAALRRAMMFLVLPVRIELTTSPLPRECSTTELRQRRAGCELRRDAAANAAILAIRATAAQAAVSPRQASRLPFRGPSFPLPRLLAGPPWTIVPSARRKQASSGV